MSKLIASACAAACLWTSAAFCQKATTTESSAYCRSAAQVLIEGARDAEVATVWQRCKLGDTIAINAGAQGAAAQIGRLCDFTKPVVNVGTQIICVLGSERGIR
jgi:hypothetical protein